MFGYGLFPSVIKTGGLIAESFNFEIFIIITLIGNILLLSYALLLSFISTTDGKNFHLVSEETFGKKGYKITSFIILVSQVGWFGVGIAFVTNATMDLLQINGDLKLLIEVAIIVILGTIMTGSAFFGIKTLKIISYIVVPIILASGIFMVILSLNGGEWGTFTPEAGSPANPIGFYAGVNLTVGTFISGATLIPDFIRWAKNKFQAALLIFFTFIVLQTILMLFGAIAYYGIEWNGDQNITLYTALSTMGFSYLGFTVLLLNVWTSNDNSIYTSALAAARITNKRKYTMVILLGTVGTIFAPAFNTTGFLVFLNLLSLFIPGIGIIIIYNHYFEKSNYENINYNFIGIISWIIGIGLTISFNQLFEFVTFVYLIIFTTISYAILIKTSKNFAEKTKYVK